MKSILKWVGLVTVVVFFAACGIITTQEVKKGIEIKDNDVQTILKGTTTEHEIVKMFGVPTKEQPAEDGGKALYYEYSKSGGLQWNAGVSVGGGTENSQLVVWLNKNGVVTDYAFKKS